MGKTKKEAKKAMGVSPITGIIYYGTLRVMNGLERRKM